MSFFYSSSKTKLAKTWEYTPEGCGVVKGSQTAITPVYKSCKFDF